jgi:transposase
MENVTIGMDLGDKKNVVCVLNSTGDKIDSCSIVNTAKSIRKYFSKYTKSTAIVEAGTHSPWISRLLEQMGFKVIVANARKLRFIWQTTNKSDQRDAEMLAEVGQLKPKLLYPIEHRGEQAQVDLALIKARDILVKTRTCLINHVRCTVKSLGERIPVCGSATFHKKAKKHLSEILKEALSPIVKQIEMLSGSIKGYDCQIIKVSQARYPAAQSVGQIPGVGPVTSLAFILTLEDAERFNKSRDVGPFIGLTPKRDQSGDTDKQLRITKAGNRYLRQLLVNCSHYILGYRGEDCDLRRYGQRICDRGGKIAKRKAVIAVSRKLSVLMHHLWRTGVVYEPLFNPQKGSEAIAV